MHRRDWLVALIIALLVSCGVGWSENRLSGLSLDLLFSLRERFLPMAPVSDPPTAIIAIDEETYRRPPFANVPSALWTNEIATLLNMLVDADANVVGFDVVFPTSMDRYVPGFDRPFLAALRRAAAVNKVVLGEVQVAAMPIKPFPAQAMVVGGDRNIRFVNLTPDPDGVIRRMPLNFTEHSETDGTRRLPSFAMELAKRALRTGLSVDNPDSLLLDFHNLDTIPSYSLADLAACATAGNKNFFRDHFSGKTVLIGAMFGIEDRKITSMRLATRQERATYGRRCALPPLPGLSETGERRDSIPGIYVTATAVNNLLAGDVLSENPPWANVAIIVAAAFAAALGALLFRPITAAAATVGAGVLWAAVSTFAFRDHLVLPLLAPLLAAALCLALLVGYRVTIVDRQKRFLRRSFAYYLAPTLIDRMVSSEKLPELGGEMREVTVLMSDLAGFTPLAEALPARELVAIINSHFSAMAEIIEDESGFIQDYAGDALLAIFGAPLVTTDHAFRATRAALRCHDRIAKLSAAPGARSLGMRIGLNTGEVLVGNIGSSRRLKYTAMGDAVNLAARLESASKLYGTTILASETTRAAAGSTIVWREIDRVRVVGRLQPVELWEPLGFDPSPQIVASVAQYREALLAYRSGDFNRARPLFDALRSRDPPASFFASKLLSLRGQPIADWDGVTDLDVK
jgi:adenylate cyclase